jgi:serine/threonine-protein kinase
MCTEETMTLEAGQLLQNRYRIISRLGQGGMGAVYRAWDTRLNVPVAVKEMIPQPGLDAAKLKQLRRQFQQEAQVLARLDHPHLVDVTDFFAEASNVYLVMKFIEGESLAHLINHQGALSEKRVVTLAEQLLEALAYCHSQGVLHRDVKPQNVIIRPSGAAVLVDFGLVKLWDPRDPRTKTAMRGMGTPEYAPPEQYDMTGHTDARSDIYSLGATLYHALTGQAPPTATQRSAGQGTFKPPRALNRSISPGVETAVLRAMELRVQDRFQSAQEMKAAFGKTVEGGTPTRLMPERRAPSDQARKKRDIPLWVLGVGGAGALVLVVLGLILVISGLDGGAEETPTSPERDVATTVPAVVTEVTAPTATWTPVPPTVTSPASPAPTSTPTSGPTSTPKGAAPSEPTESPVATATPSATATPTTTSSPPTTAPSATAPQLVSPGQGGSYQSPITFQWRGSLQPDQAYQVTAYHVGSGDTIQSELLTSQDWTVELPAERVGEWRWQVVVVQEQSRAATSSEGMFWFDPFPYGGGFLVPPKLDGERPIPVVSTSVTIFYGIAAASLLLILLAVERQMVVGWVAVALRHSPLCLLRDAVNRLVRMGPRRFADREPV